MEGSRKVKETKKGRKKRMGGEGWRGPWPENTFPTHDFSGLRLSTIPYLLLFLTS